MFKKITAICLTFILVISMAIVPVFASVNQNGATNENQANIVRYDKKDKNDKDDKTDSKKLIEDMVKKFLDSDELNWAQKSIEKMGYMGILSGNGNGYFQPKNNVTHAEAIAMVLKLTGYQDEAEAIKTEPLYFKGNSDKWSYGYLQLALDKGIIIPSEDGKFNPKTPAKRHEVAKYVVRALEQRALALQNMKVKLNYKDASSIPSGSVGYVYVISKLGIMQGSNNLFQPNSPITRAELAVILDNAESKVLEPNDPSSANESLFVSYDSVNYKLTLNVDNKNVVYNILPNTPVYKNSTYYGIGALVAGDVIKITVDSQNKVIFIEFVRDSSTVPPTGNLAMETVTYENLPQILKDKVDALKYTQSFTAFRYNQSVYLIAARGQVPTGGYGIAIKEVHKETVSLSKYNLGAVVEMTNPATDAMVTQVISYPYSIVKVNYFSGIDKVNFVDTSNTLLAQSVVNNLDIANGISGKIDSVDVANRIVRILESDNQVRSYYIPVNVIVTLNNRSSALTALTKDMTIVITTTDGIITKLAATNATETISGKIDTVSTTNRIITIIESDNVSRPYYLPANVTITLNNVAVSLSSIVKDMPVVLTRTNGVITRLAATSAAETISGKIDSVGTTNRIITIIESDNVARSYYIPANTTITLNNVAVSLSSIIKDMPVVLTRTNGIITRLAATNIALVTINGKIDSVDAANRIVKVLENDNQVRSYFIPTDVVITLNNVAVSLSSLTKDMPIVITKNDGTIIRLAASNIVLQTISGKIDSVDSANRIVRVLESDNVVRNYVIPTNVTITLNNQAVALTALTKDMLIVITKNDGVITRLAVTNVAETISGKIDSVDVANRIVKVLESDNLVKSYFIPTNITITLNNRAVSLSSLMKDMPVVLTRTNGEITNLVATNIIETINGKIDTVGTTSRIVTIIESDNAARSYYIPTNVVITINTRTALLTDLGKDMPVVLTRTNGVITRLAATNTVEIINGRIDSVDVAGKIVKLLDSNNIVTSYTIPDTALITLDNQAASLTGLLKGMKAAITKSNGLITKLAVQRDIQTIEGILVTTYTNQTRKYISVKVGTLINNYEITSVTKVYYNDVISTIESIPFNSTVVVTIENAEVVEVRNK